MPSPTTLGGVGMAAIGSFPVGGSADPFKPGTLLFLDGRNLVEDNRFQAKSLELNDVIGAGDTLEFLHQVLAGGSHIKPGQRVILRQDTVNIFLGTIDRIEERKSGGATALFSRSEAVDLTAMLERRLVTAAETYTNQTAGFIAKDLVAKYLVDEGITTNSVQAGPTLTTFSIKIFTSVGKTLRDLGDRTGFIGFVDAGGDLHFEAQTAVAAPFDLVPTLGEGTIILIAPDGGRWRVDVTDNGVLQTVSSAVGEAVPVFLMADDIGIWKLKVTNTGILQTESSSGVSRYGWRLVSSGAKPWLLRVTNAGLLTTADRDVTEALDTVRIVQSREKYRNRQTVRYASDLSLSITANDTVEQAARKVVEGGSGIYHAVEDASNISTAAEATDLANALLRRFKIPTVVRIATRRRGLKAGQSITLNFPEHTISGSHLIDSISARDDGTDQLRWEVTALSGEHLGDPMTFWRRAIGQE